jgi:hypothetical protein
MHGRRRQEPIALNKGTVLGEVIERLAPQADPIVLSAKRRSFACATFRVGRRHALGHVAFRGADDAVRVGEDLEPVLAGDGSQRHAACMRHAHRECRRRRDGDDDGGADHRRFLDHLDGDPACQHDDALGCAAATPHAGAGQLVERVMTPHVLAHGYEATSRLPKARGVDSACLAVELLMGG